MLPLSMEDNILFICKGNICRSPFAKYYAQKILPKTMNILSSGHYSETGRRCPMKAIKAAKEYDIDLRNHRSTLVTKELIQNVKIIYIFDEENRDVLFSQFPFTQGKIYLLGAIDKNLPNIIPDPYGNNYCQYKKTYYIISQAIDSINNSLDMVDKVNY